MSVRPGADLVRLPWSAVGLRAVADAPPDALILPALRPSWADRTAAGLGRLAGLLADPGSADGPDLRVWLTDQAVTSGPGGWTVFDDGRYVEAGKLKGNRGDQVYRLPAGIDPAGFRSVSIWCKRFSVSFGAAELRA